VSIDAPTLEKLHGAFELLHEAAQGLDDSETHCVSCGLRHKMNWDEARARADLLSAAGKIDRVLDVLERQVAKEPTKETGT
jgi:hypothetical protein